MIVFQGIYFASIDSSIKLKERRSKAKRNRQEKNFHFHCIRIEAKKTPSVNRKSRAKSHISCHLGCPTIELNEYDLDT